MLQLFGRIELSKTKKSFETIFSRWWNNPKTTDEIHFTVMLVTHVELQNILYTGKGKFNATNPIKKFTTIKSEWFNISSRFVENQFRTVRDVRWVIYFSLLYWKKLLYFKLWIFHWQYCIDVNAIHIRGFRI